MGKNICVFCSSSDALEEVYFKIAIAVGKQIADNKHVLLFGGANVGLMRKLAHTVKEHNGKLMELLVMKKRLHNEEQKTQIFFPIIVVNRILQKISTKVNIKNDK